MKNSIKTISVILALALAFSVFSLTGCASKTPYEKYAAMNDRMKALTDVDISADMQMSMTLNEELIDMPTKYNAKIKQTDGVISEMLMDMTITNMGTESSVKSYYFDGTAYYDADGTKYKAAMTPDEVSEQLKSANTMLLNEETMASATESKQGENTVISAVIPGEKMHDQIVELMGEELFDALAMTQEEIDAIVISDVEASYTINKAGYCAASRVAFDISMTLPLDEAGTEFVDVLYTLDTGITYNNPGQPVEITPFEDLDSYPDYSTLETGDEYLPSEEEQQLMDVIYALLELYENDEPIKKEGYDESYAALVEQYGQELVDEADEYVQSMIESFLTAQEAGQDAAQADTALDSAA